MRDVLLILLQRMEEIRAEDLFTEIPLIEGVFHHCFVKPLQLTKREFLRQQLKADRFVSDFCL